MLFNGLFAVIIKWKRASSCMLILGAPLLLAALLNSCASSAPAIKRGNSCLDCHPEYKDKFSAGVVHKPAATGDCSGCHRTHGLIGGAYLKAPVPDICFSCHKGLTGELKKATVLHLPVKEGKCNLCHQPHNSPEKYLLAAKRDVICFNCHDRAPFSMAYKHPPLENGCETCHEIHGSAVAKLLIKEEISLCKDCHKIDSSSFAEHHGGYAVNSGCSDCHNVHSAGNQHMLKNRVHQPVAAKQCHRCHQPGSGQTPFAVSAAADQLCALCHAEELKNYSAKGAHLPATKGECTSCHQVHASNFAGMLKKQPQQLCFDCHKFKSFGPQAPAEGSGSQHASAKQGDCLVCHAPHLSASGQPALLRKPGNQLCLDCHADYAANKRINHKPARSGDCLGCHLSHESVYDGLLIKQQRLLCADCHDKVNETLGQPSLHRPFVAGNCSSCHNPHGAELANLLVKPSAEICGRCHGTIETARQQPNRHQPFKDGRCDLCHYPHGSEQPFLLTGAAVELCVKCHAQQKIMPGTPSGHQNCIICHYAHGNDEPAYLMQEQPQLCLNCHGVNRFWEKGAGHKPAVDGKCQACHDPHEPQLHRVKNADAALCGQCHDISPSALAGSHRNLAPSASSCLSCHDPHGGPDRSLTLPVKHEPFDKGNCIHCHTEALKK